MRFTSFSLLCLTASFVDAAKEGKLQQKQQEPQQLLQQQQEGSYHHEVSVVTKRKQGGKKYIKGGLLVSGLRESNNNKKNIQNHYYYNDNMVNKEYGIADVGILSFNSHDYHNSDDNDNVDRVLEEPPCNRCYGENACFDTDDTAIGACSCDGDKACFKAGYFSDATIGENSCIGDFSCFYMAPNTVFNVFVGNGSCIGQYSCRAQGEYGYVEIGDESCVGVGSCDHLNKFLEYDIPRTSLKIGNRACTCDDCCAGIFPGSVVGDCQCTSLGDGCAGTLVNKPDPRECSSSDSSSMPSPAPSAMPSNSPSQMPSPAPSAMPSNSPSQMPSAADCADSICDSNPNLIAVCTVDRRGGEPRTQCVQKKAAAPLLALNEGNKCGSCAV